MRKEDAAAGDPAEAGRIRDALAGLDAALGHLTETADHDFLKIGNTLGHAVEVFGRLGGNLAGLADQLHGDAALSAIAALEQAVGCISRMAGGDNRTGPILTRLEEESVAVAKRLDGLQRIIGEIGALAINGKIQAALVTAAGIDFSVFTTEIGRLGLMAATSTEQASTRLTTVRAAVASARQAAADFERNEARELDAVRLRIQSSLAVLAERRQRAAAAAQSVAARSQDIARHIAGTVAELQINDSVCQRIEHVRAALRAMAALAVAAPVAEPGCQWLDEVAGPLRPSLIGGLCRLLAMQLDGAAADYRGEVEGLARNLSALAATAADIQAEAETAFGGSDGGLFVAEIERDIRRACELLAAHSAARQRAGSVVQAVSEGFRAMAADLATIQSIDADMRVMGLNATLKCGRLGNDGRALGVVAHELRACSKRTEDTSHAIADLLGSVLAQADALAAAAAGTGSESGEEADPVGIMAASMAALSRMGEAMASALAELRTDSGAVSSALTSTAGGIDIHRRVGQAAGEGSARLASLAGQLAGQLAGTADPTEEVHQDIHRLMQPRYTMDRERVIHHAFSGDHPAAFATPPKPEAEADDLDAMFL